MNNDALRSLKLEKHETKDVNDGHINGTLTVVWRDWDNKINAPKMVYISSVFPGEIKGPHIHTKRNSYFTCIHGKVVFIIKELDGTYNEIVSSEEQPIMIYVPKNIPSAHVNISDGISRVLTLADVAWKPNDNEMKNTEFANYDWSRWLTSPKNDIRI